MDNKKLTKQSSNLMEQSNALVTLENGKYILISIEDRELANIYMQEAAVLKKVINGSYEKIWKKNQETGKEIKHEWNNQLTVPSCVYDMLSQAIGELDNKIKKENEKKAEKERERLEKLKQEEIEKIQKNIKQGMDIKEKYEIKKEIEEIKAMSIPEIIVKASVKLKGTRTQKTVKCKIEDEITLKRYIINNIQKGELWEGFLQVNESALRKYIKQKEGKENFPGVKIWTDIKTIATGR